MITSLKSEMIRIFSTDFFDLIVGDLLLASGALLGYCMGLQFLCWFWASWISFPSLVFYFLYAWYTDDYLASYLVIWCDFLQLESTLGWWQLFSNICRKILWKCLHTIYFTIYMAVFVEFGSINHLSKSMSIFK